MAGSCPRDIRPRGRSPFANSESRPQGNRIWLDADFPILRDARFALPQDEEIRFFSRGLTLRSRPQGGVSKGEAAICDCPEPALDPVFAIGENRRVELIFHRRAEKVLRRMPSKPAAAMIAALERIAEDPFARNPNVKPLAGV